MMMSCLTYFLNRLLRCDGVILYSLSITTRTIYMINKKKNNIYSTARDYSQRDHYKTMLKANQKYIQQRLISNMAANMTL